MLEIADLAVQYGVRPALHGVSITVGKGEVVALIGANGAGKSTLLKALSGAVPVSRGTISWRGDVIDDLSSQERVRAGIIHCPEGRHVFPGMTVLENLELGAYMRPGDTARTLVEVWTMFPVLRERQRQLAGTMSGGEQQMLAIGRALMGRPTLLALDEPSLGVAPQVVDHVFDELKACKDRGDFSLLLVEQNAHLAMEIADRVYVMETGTVVLEGKPEDIAESPVVRDAYLGG